MSLINKKDLIQAAGLDLLGPLQSPVADAAMKLTKLDEVNALYDKVKDKAGAEFFQSFVRELDLKYVVYEEDLAKIPKTGPFIIAANHPLGAIDGILMCKLISKIRPDFKLMGNFLLSRIEPLTPYLISVNPFEDRKEAYSSMAGMRASLKYLEEGGCIGIFPAGEVSNKNNEYGEILDKEWEKPVLKLIKKAKVPVIPMYFHAKNSNFFYLAAKTHPRLQTLLLPAEMMKPREKPIGIRISKPISVKVLDELDTAEEVGKYLKKRVYMLKSYYERRKTISEILKLPNLNLKLPLNKHENRVHNIIEETSREDLLKEIDALKDGEKSLFRSSNYEVFFSKYDDIPFIMREIGRQRELSFRSLGEGTNLPFDLDSYDKHYHHLFLWDHQEEKLVGAYRMALGKQIMKNQGIEGFYTNSLFDFDPELYPFFKKVIEMGRAYVALEYQQKPLPLFLLWRGIVHVCLRNPEYKFLMGGVSISNKFSDFSKSLMIEFMRSHYYDSAVAHYVHPKNDYKIHLRERDKNLFFDEMKSDLNKLDKLIDDLEPQMRMPVLMKKYVKQNAKVIAFNVDPNFNDTIDGLMYIRISDLPEETIKPVLEEIGLKFQQEDQMKNPDNQ